MRLIVVVGAAVFLFSVYNLPFAQLDLRFFFLAFITIGIGSYLTIQIPYLSSYISVSDTFIFLAMLLYGGEAAILLAAVVALCESLRFSRKAMTMLFNSAVTACSTFLTVWTLRLCLGPVAIVDLPRSDYSATFIVAICIMALAQYIFNSSLVAVLAAYKTDRPIWDTWKKSYLWTSITFFAGASAAGIIAKLVDAVGFYSIIVTTPIIAIIYFTYQMYLENVAAAAAQAKQAERHVEELNHYIAERKRAEEERDRLLVREQEARAEAEAANRIKDEFLATLSHELRTPMTSILGWAELLRIKPMLDEETRTQAVESIERSAKIEIRLIDELLDVARIASGKLYLSCGPIDLISVIEAAIDVVRPAANAKNIEILYKHDLVMGAISGDAARLQQVVWNLLFNAVKFTPEGGRVDVRLERVGSHAKIIVSDTGKGISAEFLPYVFDRFRQADSTTARDYGGLGLGLALVRHLVELHGGTIHAESQGEGQGATFSVDLPLVAVRMEAGEVEREYQRVRGEWASDHPSALEGLRVLVVEDEAYSREIITAVLKQGGADVRTSASAREALEVLEQWKPDVLMSDIGMPNEDGYAFIHKVRELSEERGGRIPAAALTAYVKKEDRTRVLAAGYQMHVAKPIGPSELIMAVADLSKLAVNFRAKTAGG
jgi:signal transduction histidine kinase/CheY-like chemotaxis protein